MQSLLAVLFCVWLVYAVTVYWLIFWRGPWRTAYNPWIGRALRWRGMQAVTLGPTTYVYLPSVVLTPQGTLHERFHFEQQQRKYPLRFFPRYLYEMMRFGYDRSPIENEARAAAGEPLR